MPVLDDRLPTLSDTLVPPVILGTADLTDFAYQGHDLDQMIQRIEDHRNGGAEEAACLYDTAIAYQLAFRRSEGLNRLDEVLEHSQLFRVRGNSNATHPLRLLALVSPGDLMANAPLDFLTNHLNVRLDLLYILPDRPLPPIIPDHDVAFFAVGEADPAELCRLRHLFTAWPRPALNDPAFLSALQRDILSQSLTDAPGICSPTAMAMSRIGLGPHLREDADVTYPCLIRPLTSHAGAGLARVETPAELADYLRVSFDPEFYLTKFEDYSDPDGFYRKSRVAFIDGQPFLCHMAISSHWMVHYLNAGMAESAEKRAEEARAMAEFDQGFARRHAAAFDALHKRIGLDYYSIDCAETHDGRLLVFEADAAAIIHLMDPPDMFPYKHRQMHRVFAAFETMLRNAPPLSVWEAAPDPCHCEKPRATRQSATTRHA